MARYRHALCWLFLGLLLTCGVTPQVSPSPTLPPVTPSVSPSPVPSPTTVGKSISLDGWQLLYQREAWDGRATIDLRATGDLMLGRLVGTLARREGYDYPFAAADALLAGDLTLGNLESPLTTLRSPMRPGPYRLPADPQFAAALHAADFDLLSLANNHALDVGAAGLQEAVQALETAGIHPVGVGADATAAAEPVLLKQSGLRLAVLGLNDVADPEDRPDEGLAWGRDWLNEAALTRIRELRPQVDLLIVLVHWGTEYAATPSERQRDWAAQLVSAGTDLIIGAHPHVLQPAVTLEAGGRRGFVAYSLGNFLFDQFDRPETSRSAVLRVLLDSQGVAAVAAAPIAITAGQARRLTLDDPVSRQVLADLTAAESADESGTSAWTWDGKEARLQSSPAALPRPEPLAGLAVDLRGDGEPLWLSIDADGVATIRATDDPTETVLWQNEGSDWQVTRIAAGDLDGDGRIEALLLLWRPGEDGKRGSHPFMIGWRGGMFRVLWGGSATRIPMQDIAVGDLDGDGRQELIVLEGGSAPGDAGETVSIWRWQGWMFEQQWRSESGSWRRIALRDQDGDGRAETLVAWR